MTNNERLYQLQRLDSRLAELAGTLAALDDGSTLRAEVDRVKHDEEAAQADMHNKQARLRALELELQSITAKAHKVEQDLYSGRVTNPKELTAMQDDLQGLGRQRQRLEDEMLTVMEEIEQLLGQIRTLEGSREDGQRALEEHVENFRSRREALSAEMETARAERAALAAGIDEALLRRYELLRGRKGGIAVARVVRGICEGCHVAIPERRLAQLLDPEADHIYTCEGCGRILYAKAI